MWNILGRVQWYIGSSRQLEKRNSTIQRANKVIDLCESQNEDLCRKAVACNIK